MTSTNTYQIHLTRYKDHKRRQSGPNWVQATNFREAMGLAEAMLMGSREADPDAEFEIASVAASGLGGHICMSGWQTKEEIVGEEETA